MRDELTSSSVPNFFLLEMPINKKYTTDTFDVNLFLIIRLSSLRMKLEDQRRRIDSDSTL